MAIFSFKYTAAVLIFLTGLIGGLLPLMSTREKNSWTVLHYLEAVARGIFLSVALIHMLPDAELTFHKIPAYANVSYPLIFVIATFTIFIIHLIEGYAKKYASTTGIAQSWKAYLLLILFSIHSIITGAALGVSTTLSHSILIFVAIIAHKAAAGFALSVNMLTQHIKKRAIFSLICLFAIMTPFGIIVASLASRALHNHGATLAQAVFNAIAAGTFLYIASFKTVKLESESSSGSILSTLYFGVGIAVMAVVAIWA